VIVSDLQTAGTAVDIRDVAFKEWSVTVPGSLPAPQKRDSGEQVSNRLAECYKVATLPKTPQQQQLVISADEYRYVANFDPAQISEARLREMLLFSPYDFGSRWKLGNQQVLIGSQKTKTRVDKGPLPFFLSLCVDNDPSYRPCGNRDVADPNFFANAEINVKKNEQVATLLNRVDVPLELHIVWKEFTDSFAFFSTVEHRQLEYLRTGDIRALSTPIVGIDPSKECPGILEDLRAATTLRSRYDLLRSWHSCLVPTWWQTSPPYPVEAWSKFLRVHGITEQYVGRADCR
jgi:hypothetical protein